MEANTSLFLTLPPGIFVVSSNHPDPLAMLQTLSSSQQQQQSQFPHKLPQWFCPNILKFFVILHDVVEAEAQKWVAGKRDGLLANVNLLCYYLRSSWS